MNPYLSETHVRAALRGLGLRPTRGMGQNFLVDAAALAHIVDAAALAPTDIVVEVGPGLGVLTWELRQRAAQVVAVELDKRLAARLRSEMDAAPLQHSAPLHMVQADVLRTPPRNLLRAAGLAGADADDGEDAAAPPYLVVANLPYAITSPVLRHFLEQPPRPLRMVVLVQWEVAERICAAPGHLSMLAHAIQMYAEPEIVARIGADCFFPQPAVDSAVLRLHVRSAPAVAPANHAQISALFRIIKAGFLQPRKKLSNALPGGLAALGIPIERDAARAAIAAADIDSNRRAETLTLAEWAALARALGVL